MLKKRIVALVCATLLLASGCGKAESQASRAVEEYLQALVAGDVERITALSCAEWEANARMEVDSFQAVKTRLEDLTCEESGQEAGSFLVQCAGKIIATYNNEDQEIDLSARAYRVIEQGGEYLVCGYR